MTPVISIIHPSRSRHNKAKECRDSWLIKMSCDAPREYIIALDQSDPSLSDYEEIFYPGEVFVSDSKNVVEAVNNAATVCIGDIIIILSDDFQCFENWDLKVIDALKGESGVLKTWDGIQKRIITLPIITRDYYEEMGHVFDPAFRHSWADTWLTDVAHHKGRVITRLDIEFPHDHYSVLKQEPDELYKRNDLTHDRDRHIYQRKLKELNASHTY